MCGQADGVCGDHVFQFLVWGGAPRIHAFQFATATVKMCIAPTHLSRLSVLGVGKCATRVFSNSPTHGLGACIAQSRLSVLGCENMKGAYTSVTSFSSLCGRCAQRLHVFHIFQFRMRSSGVWFSPFRTERRERCVGVVHIFHTKN